MHGYMQPTGGHVHVAKLDDNILLLSAKHLSKLWFLLGGTTHEGATHKTIIIAYAVETASYLE